MTTLRDMLVRTLACCAAFALLPTCLLSRVSAKEIEWRYDYGKARQEAIDTGRPLVIDVGTENCFYCKKLDMYTFRDPAIVVQMNERCIPLKVDAERQPDLAGKLRIQNYPTLVYASPDGRVLGSQEGFVEAPVLKDQLDRILAATGEPEWMLRNFADATKAREAGDFSKALALLKPILEEAKGRPIHARATQQVQELDLLVHQLEAVKTQPPVKPQEVASAKPIEPTIPQQTPLPPVAMVPPPPPAVPVGPTLVAPEETPVGQGACPVVAMTELSRVIKGALANRKGAELVLTIAAGRSDSMEQLRLRQAEDTLLQAKEDYRRQHYLACLDRCEMLMANYADLNLSQEAQKMAAEIKKNPEWTKLACDQLGERLGVLYLNLAETWLGKGEPQQAIFYLERVIQTAPNTRHAEMAQVRLSQLQGQPMPKTPDLKRPDVRSE
jgi:tetratricopeptide (TPR) repeat protein